MDLSKRLAAEAIGTAFLLMAITGSGIAAERYAADPGVALLANAASIGAALTVLIAIFGPASGAHFNPAVTAMFRLRGEITTAAAAAYVLIQCVAGALGVWASHAMYGEAILQIGTNDRGGPGAWLAEAIATFGLVTTILFVRRGAPGFVAGAVGLFIFSAIWFTASTAFANPAVTIARALTETYVGIRPADVAGFIGAQLLGAGIGAAAFAWMTSKNAAAPE